MPPKVVEDDRLNTFEKGKIMDQQCKKSCDRKVERKKEWSTPAMSELSLTATLGGSGAGEALGPYGPPAGG
jgi:hypothetical protein